MDQGNTQFVSIIIPVLNAEKYIGDCLSSISSQTLVKTSFEIILVDNGSTDATLKITNQFLNDFSLKIFVKPKLNIPSLRNFGVKQAKGNTVAFLDSDCIVDINWLKSGLSCLRAGDIKPGLVGAPYSIPPKSSWIAKAWALNSSNIIKKGETDWLPSGNMFIKKEVFLKVGGFNEHLETNEDYYLCQSVREASYAIYSDPAIKNTHLGTPQTLPDFFKKELWHGKAVFKVFLQSDLKLSNIKAVSFALFYVTVFLGVLGSLLFNLYNTTIIFIAIAFILPIFLAIATSYKARRFNYLPGLIVLYLAYGIARAICILNFSWLNNE